VRGNVTLNAVSLAQELLACVLRHDKLRRRAGTRVEFRENRRVVVKVLLKRLYPPFGFPINMVHLLRTCCRVVNSPKNGEFTRPNKGCGA
jgi:hypothetical protein